MKTKNYMLVAAAAAMLALPTVATAGTKASDSVVKISKIGTVSSRKSRSVAKKHALAPAVLIGVLATVAIVGSTVVITSNDDNVSHGS